MSHERLPLYEWCLRAGRGELEALDWVDVDPDAERDAWAVGADGRFQARSYAAMLPPPMARAAAEAHASGEPTLLAGLTACFARPEWLVHGRSLLWSPTGPVPGQLKAIFDALGVPAELHRGEPERMVRLAVRLKSWRERAGEVELALALLRDVAGQSTDAIPRAPRPEDEILACRGHAWWRARRPSGMHLRIEGGWVRFQGGGAQTPMLPEDVAVLPGAPLSVLVRLLPTWACLRVHAPAEVSR